MLTNMDDYFYPFVYDNPFLQNEYALYQPSFYQETYPVYKLQKYKGTTPLTENGTFNDSSSSNGGGAKECKTYQCFLKDLNEKRKAIQQLEEKIKQMEIAAGLPHLSSQIAPQDLNSPTGPINSKTISKQIQTNFEQLKRVIAYTKNQIMQLKQNYANIQSEIANLVQTFQPAQSTAQSTMQSTAQRSKEQQIQNQMDTLQNQINNAQKITVLPNIDQVQVPTNLQTRSSGFQGIIDSFGIAFRQLFGQLGELTNNAQIVMLVTAIILLGALLLS